MSGNKVALRTESGAIIPDVHLEDVVVIPGEARLIERDPLEVEPTAEAGATERLESARSPGEMIENPADQDKSDQTSPSKKITPTTGKLAKIGVGQYVAYDAEAVRTKTVKVGKVTTVNRAQSEVVIH